MDTLGYPHLVNSLPLAALNTFPKFPLLTSLLPVHCLLPQSHPASSVFLLFIPSLDKSSHSQNLQPPLFTQAVPFTNIPVGDPQGPNIYIPLNQIHQPLCRRAALTILTRYNSKNITVTPDFPLFSTPVHTVGNFPTLFPAFPNISAVAPGSSWLTHATVNLFF